MVFLWLTEQVDSQCDLMKSSVVKLHITQQMRVSIREHIVLKVNPDYWCDVL